MGGSGGGGGMPPFDAGEMLRKLAESSSESDKNRYESEVGDILAAGLADYNQRDVAAIERHLEEIRTSLGDEVDIESIVFGGSVSKKTFVNGLSDVDALICLNEELVADMGPLDLINDFSARLKRRFPNTTVSKGDMAVTVAFQDVTVQVIPAIRQGGRYLVSDEAGNWLEIDPRRFALALTQANREAGGKTVPCVKLAKALLANRLPEDRRPTGYHLEALAVQASSASWARMPLKDCMVDFLRRAEEAVTHPLTDKTGQTTYVDEYLGRERSVARRLLADDLRRVRAKLELADAGRIVDIWKELFE